MQEDATFCINAVRRLSWHFLETSRRTPERSRVLLTLLTWFNSQARTHFTFRTMLSPKPTTREVAIAVAWVMLAQSAFSLFGVCIQLFRRVPAMQWAFCRCFFGLVLVTAWMLYENRRMWGNRKAKVWVAIRGTMTGITNILYIATLLMLPLGTGLSLVSTYPLWSMLFGRVFLKEKLGWSGALSVFGVTTGAVLIGRPSFIFGESDSGSGSTLGYAAAVLASFTTGVYLFAARKCSEEGRFTLEQLFSFNLFGSVFAFMGAWVVPGQEFISLTTAEWGAVAVVVSTSLAVHWSYSNASNYIPTGFLGVLASSELVYGFLWQVFYFAQHSHFLSYVGAALIFGCICAVSIEKVRASNTVAPPQNLGFETTPKDNPKDEMKDPISLNTDNVAPSEANTRLHQVMVDL